MFKGKTKPVEEELASKIKKAAEESQAHTESWRQNQTKWHKMRMRIKKEKNFPFVGCSNIRMPTIETKIRKVKSNLVNVIFGIRPVVQAIPTPSGNWQSAQKIEKFLDHLIMDKMSLKPKAVIAIDQSIEKGFFCMKPYWKVTIIPRTEKLSANDLSEDEAAWFFSAERTPDEMRQAIIERMNVDMNPLVSKENELELSRVLGEIQAGKMELSAEFQDVICDYPDVALCEPEKLYVSTDSGYSPQSSSFIIHEFMMPLDQVRDNVKLKGWSADGFNQIKDSISRTKQDGTPTSWSEIKDTKDKREGIQNYKATGKVKIWEYYGYEDINGDGRKEKCVVTLAADFSVTLRKIAIPFSSGKFPFVKLFYELTDDRWFAHRGIPELIEDVAKEIDMQHNQKLDNQTMRNAPMFMFRAGQVNKNTIQFIFGQGIAVSGMQSLDDVIRPLNLTNTNAEYSYEKEQMILEGKIEELIGQVDYNLQSMVNRRQPRTLGEVQLQQQNMQTVFSLDAQYYQLAFEELFNWIWDLWCEYGSDEYEFAYFGQEGYEKIKMTREELQGKYKIVVRGNDQNTNPQIRLQKAQMILQSTANQFAIQSGVVTPQNLANAYKRFYQELDIPNWQELITMPEPPPQPPPPVKIGMEDMTDMEQAQVLSKYGIQPDVQARQLKSAAKIQEKQHEQSSKDIQDFAKLMGAIPEEGETEESSGE